MLEQNQVGKRPRLRLEDVVKKYLEALGHRSDWKNLAIDEQWV